MFREHGPFVVTSARRSERGPHPTGQEAFVLRIQLPWQRYAHRSIKVEITVDEPLALAPEIRPLLHPYGEALGTDLLVYALEEIIAEKLRTPLQAQRRVAEGSWARNCARDYYDLWYLLQLGEDVPDLRTVFEVLPQKCAVRSVSFDDVGDFFPPLIVSEAKRRWTTSLADLVRPLPDFDQVIADLRARLRTLLAR